MLRVQYNKMCVNRFRRNYKPCKNWSYEKRTEEEKKNNPNLPKPEPHTDVDISNKYKDYVIIKYKGYYFALQDTERRIYKSVEVYESRYLDSSIIIESNESPVYMIKYYADSSVENIKSKAGDIYSNGSIFCSKDLKDIKRALLFL